jgi:hypothetical protein
MTAKCFVQHTKNISANVGTSVSGGLFLSFNVILIILNNISANFHSTMLKI